MATPKSNSRKFSSGFIATVIAQTIAVVTAQMMAMYPCSAVAKTQTGDSGVEKELRFNEGDESGNEVKALKTELLVTNSEKKALTQLLKLEKKYAGTPMEPDLLFRLAELFMRRARSERFFEVHRSDTEIMSLVPATVKQASEAKEIRRAIGYYDRISTKFPNFRMMDVVEFNTGYAYQQLGENQSAKTHYQKVVDHYHNSNLVPDSYLAIGEIEFKDQHYQVALNNFLLVAKYPEARVYPYGLYKAAWCDYNLQDAGAGMKKLEEVIHFGAKVAENHLDSKLDLRKEALSDMTLFFSDVRPPERAVDYFIQIAGEMDPSEYIMRLEHIYKRHGKSHEVEVVLTQLLAKLPDSPAVPEAHDELVWNYDHTKHYADAMNQLDMFEKYCQAHQPPAKSKKVKAPVVAGGCQETITDTSRKLAVKWHAIWKKFGDPTPTGELAVSSERAYRMFLRRADHSNPELPAVRYAFGDLMFAQKKYREASEIYAGVEEDRKAGVPVDSKTLENARYGSALALEKAVADKWSDDDEEKFNQYTTNYLSGGHDQQLALELQFKRAFIRYEKGKYALAAPEFKKIGWAKYPADQPVNEKITKSQDLYLDILNIQKDYKGLREAAQQLLAIVAPGGERSSQINKIYREAYFSEIQQMEEHGQLVPAIEAYKKFALENSTTDLAPKAWWNASQLQFRIGDATGGANTCYQMHKLFPSSDKGKECLTKAATTFESMARLDLAAKVLLNLAEVEEEKRDHWREVAADFFALSGSRDRAISMYFKLAEDKKGPQQLALYEKAETLARASADSANLATIETFYSSQHVEPQASRLVVEQAEALVEKGDLSKAFTTARKVLGRDLPKNLLARARMVEARVLEDEYRKQSVRARVSTVGKVLAYKTEKLEKVQQAYQSTIHFGDPETSVKALVRLGECYLDFANTVRNMNVINALSPEDQKSFRAEIEQMAVPMEEKGVESVNQALLAAKKGQLRNGEIATLQAQVNKLNMKPASTVGLATIDDPQILLPSFHGLASVTDKEIQR